MNKGTVVRLLLLVLVLTLLAGCGDSQVPLARAQLSADNHTGNRYPPNASYAPPIDAPPAQALPNMGQQITPLAPPGSRFEPLNPDLPDNPAWLAGQAVTTVVSPDGKTLLVLTSGYNRVFNANGPHFHNCRDSNEYVFIYDISTHTAGQEAGRADPKYLQRDCLRSIRHGLLRVRRLGDFPFDSR